MTEKRWLALILVLFLLLGIVYAVITPVFEASDELWHYPMIRHLADGNSLPVQVMDPTQAGPWKQEASQPPLYYYVGALLTFWIDTSDMENIRWLNPHVDTGVQKIDGNLNLVVHDPDASQFQGTLLAVRVVRFFSVILGALTVYLTYWIAKSTAPDRPEIALGAAAVNAFLPMYIFISGAVNNDNLVITLSSASLLLMILIGTKDLAGRRRYFAHITLGCLIGLAALTKMSALGLAPLAIGTIFISRWRANGRSLAWPALRQILWQGAGLLLLVIVPALLIAGWWYLRNINLYGDWTGWNAFIAVLGQRQTPASLAQLWDERWGFMLSYWGLFGGLNVFMPEWIYWLLNSLVIVSVIGFVVFAFQQVSGWLKRRTVVIKGLSEAIAALLRFIEDFFPLVLCLLWVLVVVIGLIRWANITWSSQGRLVFSAISALSVLMVTGLVGWLPRRPATIALSVIASFMFVIALLAPFLWIQPAYDVQSLDITEDLVPVDHELGDVIRLDGYISEADTVKPGDWFSVALAWQALETTTEDWSVFVHLVDPVLEGPIAQRDMFNYQGLRPTSLNSAGDQWIDHYSLQLPKSAIAPADLELRVGLYNFKTGQRLPLASGDDNAWLKDVHLEAIASDIPNPQNINFENMFELVGFEIAPRRVPAGDTIDLTLYWQPKVELDEDFTFFAQVVDSDTTRWASQDLLQGTSQWKPGEIYSVDMSLPLLTDTPSSIYPLIIGVYTQPAESVFDRLQVVTSEGRLTDDFFVLTSVRIDSQD